MKTFQRRAKQTAAPKSGNEDKENLLTTENLFSIPTKNVIKFDTKSSTWASRSLNYKRSTVPLEQIAERGLRDLTNSVLKNAANAPPPKFAPSPAPTKKKPANARGRWNREREEKETQRHAIQMGELRQFFEEVDDFSLVEESPGMASPLVFVKPPAATPIHAPNDLDASMLSTGGKQDALVGAMGASPSPMRMGGDTPAAIPEEEERSESPLSTSPEDEPAFLGTHDPTFPRPSLPGGTAGAPSAALQLQPHPHPPRPSDARRESLLLPEAARRSSCFLGLSRRTSVLIHPQAQAQPTPGRKDPTLQGRPSSLRASLAPPRFSTVHEGGTFAFSAQHPADSSRLSMLPPPLPQQAAPRPSMPAGEQPPGEARVLGRLSLALPVANPMRLSSRLSTLPPPPLFHEAPRVSLAPAALRPSLLPSVDSGATFFAASPEPLLPAFPPPSEEEEPAAPPTVSQAADAEVQEGEELCHVSAPASLGPEGEAPLPPCPDQPEPEPLASELLPLQQLALACGQSPDLSLLPSMDALLSDVIHLARARKIGEGTFGEAFKEGDRVIKIVPVDGEVLVNGERQKSAGEVMAEVVVTQRLSDLCRERDRAAGAPRAADRDDVDTSRDPSSSAPSTSTSASAAGERETGPLRPNVTRCFVRAHRVGLCRGRYSTALRDEWHRWARENGSENDAVDVFPEGQCYCVFVLSDGGVDLEHFELRGFEEARSLLLQTAFALAVAEEALQFEHRDLHWGNLLLRRTPLQRASCRLRGVGIDFPTEGLQVTIIDFTLSRLVAEDGTVAFCDLEADPELFKGPRGNCQADTYRRMRKCLGGKWSTHNAETNCMWMHYLADCLLNDKAVAMAPSERHELKSFRKRALGYKCAADLVWDDLFAEVWHSTE